MNLSSIQFFFKHTSKTFYMYEQKGKWIEKCIENGLKIWIKNIQNKQGIIFHEFAFNSIFYLDQNYNFKFVNKECESIFPKVFSVTLGKMFKYINYMTMTTS